jgi:hypothetical protein
MATLFYSWQSDSPANLNRDFIERALLLAIERLKSEAKVEPADRNLELDKDTKNIGGSPPITQTILNKIDVCNAFVADLTFVAKSFPKARKRLVPNPNVLLEYGYALRCHGHEKIVSVMNTAFGEPKSENLPFDLRHLRWPITYHLHEIGGSNESTILEALTSRLTEELRLILKSSDIAEEQQFIRHPSIEGDPSAFFTTPEALVPEGSFGRSVKITNVPNRGRAFLRLNPSRPVAAFESELDARNAAGKALRPMGSDYTGWSHTRNAFGAIAWAPPSDDGSLYNLTQLFLTKELWGIDAFAVNADRCREFMRGKVNGFIMSTYVERLFAETLFHYVLFARQLLDLPLPLNFEAGLVGVKGYPMALHQGGLGGKMLENSIVWNGQILSDETPVNEILQPFLGYMWKKCGVPRPQEVASALGNFVAQLRESSVVLR